MPEPALPQICGASLFCPRGQCVLILLAACRELGGSPSKAECLDFISDARWFQKDLGQDLRPYPQSTTNEHRWKTLFAWARNNAAEDDCIRRGAEGYWPITQKGKQEVDKQFGYLREKDIRLRLMFLASERFKNYIMPGYQKSDADLPRPPTIYEDGDQYVHHDIVRLMVLNEFRNELR